MLFNFSLRPLREIQPWEHAGEKHLSWFGLTDGEYWIEAGADRLFEYSPQVREKGFPRFCDYQVVRLYEDVLEMLPAVMEPVPADLVPYVSLAARDAWRGTVDPWLEDHKAELGEDGYWAAQEIAHESLRARRLDSLYLSPSTSIEFWSDEAQVHIEWDNRGKLAHGVPAWTATAGACVMTRDEFTAEVQSFHDRLMAEMARRVEEVRSGALPPDVMVDVPELIREQAYRASPIARQLLARPVTTDWNALRGLIERIHLAGKH